MIGGYISTKIPVTPETFTDAGVKLGNYSSDYPNYGLAINVELKLVVQGLLDSNTGWQLDTSKNATIDDIIDGNPGSNSDRYPIRYLCLTHLTGAKLMVVNFGDYSSSISNWPLYSSSATRYFMAKVNSSYDPKTTYSQTYMYNGGIAFSMIPANSSSEFGTIQADNWLPEDATRLSPYGSSYSNCLAWNITHSYTSYGHFIEDANWYIGLISSSGLPFVGIYFCNDKQGYPMNFNVCGEIWKNVPDDEMYGSLRFGSGGGFPSSPSSTNDAQYYSSFWENSGTLAYWGMSSTGGIDQSKGVHACFKTNLGWFSGAQRVNSSFPAGCSWRATNDWANFYFICDMTSVIPWSAVFAYISSDNKQALYCHTTGNGIFGMLDPDIFRITSCSYSNYGKIQHGTILENGNFIYLGGGTIMGWDPSNYADQNPYYNPGA